MRKRSPTEGDFARSIEQEILTDDMRRLRASQNFIRHHRRKGVNEKRRDEDVRFLRLLANWFDDYDRRRGASLPNAPGGPMVGKGLRRIAGLIENEENQAMYADEPPVIPARLTGVYFTDRGDIELRIDAEIGGKQAEGVLRLRPLELDMDEIEGD